MRDSGEQPMTKPIVAFHWLRSNGRQQKQQSSQEKQHQPKPTLTAESKAVPHRLKKIFKRGGA